jgi:hypothetical protein
MKFTLMSLLQKLNSQSELVIRALLPFVFDWPSIFYTFTPSWNTAGTGIVEFLFLSWNRIVFVEVQVT